MELQLVSKEVAILAKELGFDWSTRVILDLATQRKLYSGNTLGGITQTNNSELRNGEVSLPEQELLRKWLRDVHKIDISHETPVPSYPLIYFFTIRIKNPDAPNDSLSHGFNRHQRPATQEYELGLEDALFVALKLLWRVVNRTRIEKNEIKDSEKCYLD